MNFNDALVQLKAQVPVYRLGWEPQDGYIVMMPGMAHIWKIVLKPAPNAGNYIFSIADFDALDWAPFAGIIEHQTLDENTTPEIPAQ